MRRLKKLSKRPRTSGLLAGCLAGLALLGTASAASAVTYRPTRTDDPKPNGCKAKDCSLREAVIAANASGTPATILLRPGKRYVLARKGAGENAALTGDLDISSGPLTVKTEGGGKSNQATIDANRIDRIFDGSVTLNGITLRDGLVSGNTGVGGAIRGDVLDLRNSRLINNTANGQGSSLNNQGSGGAIYVNSGGELRIDGTRLKGNKATPGAGGAIFISKGGSASLFKSTLANNESGSGGGLAIDAGGRAEVNRSTICGQQERQAISVPVAASASTPSRWDRRRHSRSRTQRSPTTGPALTVAGSAPRTRMTPGATRPWSSTTSRSLATKRGRGWIPKKVRTAARAEGSTAARGDSVSIHNSVVALNTIATHHRPAISNDCFLRPDFLQIDRLLLAGAQPDRQPRRLHRLRPHRPVRREARAGQARRQRRAHQDDRADEGLEGDRPRGARCGSRRSAWGQARQQARHRRLRAESQEVAKVLLSMQSDSAGGPLSALPAS